MSVQTRFGVDEQFAKIKQHSFFPVFFPLLVFATAWRVYKRNESKAIKQLRNTIMCDTPSHETTTKLARAERATCQNLAFDEKTAHMTFFESASVAMHEMDEPPALARLRSRFDHFCDYTSIVGFRLLRSDFPLAIRSVCAHSTLRRRLLPQL